MRTRAPYAALFAVVMAATLLATGRAEAERLIAALSSNRITITPNYIGEELVLFGTIEGDGEKPPALPRYDLVVTVAGPSKTIVTRRKDRVFGLWVNTDSVEFDSVPGYYLVASNRELTAIATIDRLQSLRLGLAYALPTRGPRDNATTEELREAYLRISQERGLYYTSDNGVQFLSPLLFRATIPLPANVPNGRYTVNIKVFGAGALLTQAETSFEITKVGFEQFVAENAKHNGLAYGIVTALMALLTGWLASIIFRRD